MSDASAPAPPAKPGRRVLPIVLIILATLIGIAAVMAIWVKRQALETDTWTETSTELLQNQEIRDAIAIFVTDQVYANVDVSGEIETVLPEPLAGLSGPISGALRNLVETTAQKALESPRFQAIWQDANELAHAQLLKLLDDKGEFVSTTGGAVTLNLGVLVQAVADEVGIGQNLAAKLPADAAQITILESDGLAAAQTGVKVLRTLAWFLAALCLLLFALAIFLARGWRRECLRLVGVAFMVIGIIVLVARGAAGNVVVDSLAATDAARPAIDATWTIGTSLLSEGGQALILYGILIILAAWLAGPTRIATGARRGVTPYLRRPEYAYGFLALALLLLFWWDPIEATHRLLPSLVLILVSVIGVEALRRQVIREFPDRVESDGAFSWAKGGGAVAVETPTAVAPAAEPATTEAPTEVTPAETAELERTDEDPGPPGTTG